MPSGPFTMAQRDALLAVLAMGLIVAPLWTPALHLDDPQYRYQGVVIETDGAEMGFATEPSDPHLGISERIACAGERWGRACAFEQYVAANHTVPTRIYAGRDHGFRDYVLDHRYEYVYLDGTVYQVGTIPNTTVTGHGGHRLDLAHRSVEADRALNRVSVSIEDVAPPVRRAARTGRATGYVGAVPETTIELEDGTYRRVYIANTSHPADHESDTESLLTFGLPLVGLGLLGRSWRRFDVEVSVRHTPRE